MKSQKDKFSMKDFFDFKEVFKYFFRKRGVDKRPEFSLRVMHGINKLSIVIFLIAIIILIIRILFWE